MEHSQNKTRTYWLYTFISLAAMILLLIVIPEWFWLALPFFLTYLVMAFDAM
jgi:hypothetical protein